VWVAIIGSWEILLDAANLKPSHLGGLGIDLFPRLSLFQPNLMVGYGFGEATS
jgi:hypothetical protein